MEDIREKLESLHKLAESQREQKARIKGKLDMLDKSLKDMGLSASKATAEINKLRNLVTKDNGILKKMIDELQDEYSERL